jgi:nitrous oxidase accessory protein NosD
LAWKGEKMKKDSVSIEAILVLLLICTAHATTWYVHPDSTLNSIQTALNMCSTGDTVLVGPGAYVENIVWPVTQSIYLQSEYGPDTTTIDGNLAGRVIELTSQTDSATTIDGFTITRGSVSFSGGGIRCRYNSSVTVVGCIVDSNTTTGSGAGIYCGYNSSAVIMNNTISNNSSTYGGAGIDCGDTSHVTIVDNIIIGNE